MYIIQIYMRVDYLKYVKKSMSMYKFTNPQTLFSDVVKRGIVTNDEGCKKKSVSKSTVENQVAETFMVTVHTKV